MLVWWITLGRRRQPVHFISRLCAASPHGLRTGDLIKVPQLGGLYLPITGGASPPTIDGKSVTVTHGSTKITFADPLTLTGSLPITINHDTSGQAYLITSPLNVPATVFTMSPAYLGTPAAGDTATSTAAYQLQQNLSIGVVTSDTTVGFIIYSSHGHMSGAYDLVNSPISVSTNITAWSLVKGDGGYEYICSLATKLGGRPWVILTPCMSDDCIEDVATRIASICPSGMEILVELSSEHWNFSQYGNSLFALIGSLMPLLPVGTVFNDYYTTDGSALTATETYTILAAHMHDVLQAKFDALGSGLTVGRIFGMQWANSGYTNRFVMLQLNRRWRMAAS